jgi:GTP-binding protein HflX
MSRSATVVEPSLPRAVLVGLLFPGLSDEQVERSLAELDRLCQTLGLRVVARLTQRRPGPGEPTVLGAGKLEELAALTRGEDGRGDDGEAETGRPRRRGDDDAAGSDRPTVVVFDHDLTPTQLRNVERATGAEVLDRSSLILRIFQRHARTREARLQVELAGLLYLTPRLRSTGARRDRQQGGRGTRAGAGESDLELDRRRVRDRIAELGREIAAVEREGRVRRARRADHRLVSLVGYTNAGKSTLMRALTGAEVLVADRLFATLDTTVRAMQPETVPPVLVSDTVGFIDRLPHDLVASFRSTLSQARDADLLLHVADASDPALADQLRVTRQVLAEIGAADRPSLLVLNKADRLDAAARARLQVELPDGLLVSALDGASTATLHQRIVAWLDGTGEDAELFVPWVEPHLLGAIRRQARVVGEVHDERGTRLSVRAPAEVLARLRAVAGRAVV